MTDHFFQRHPHMCNEVKHMKQSVGLTFILNFILLLLLYTYSTVYRKIFISLHVLKLCYSWIVRKRSHLICLKLQWCTHNICIFVFLLFFSLIQNNKWKDTFCELKRLWTVSCPRQTVRNCDFEINTKILMNSGLPPVLGLQKYHFNY